MADKNPMFQNQKPSDLARFLYETLQHFHEEFGVGTYFGMFFFTHIQSGYHFFGFRCFHPGLDIWGIMYDLVHLDEETNEKLEEMLEHIIELDDIKNGWASQAATK